MPMSYTSNTQSRLRDAQARLPLSSQPAPSEHTMSDAPAAPALRTDAFGGTAPVAPAPAANTATANASPPAAAVNKPAAAATPAATPAAPATPATPAGTKPAEPHMPKVGTVTQANPTGDPKLDPALNGGAGPGAGTGDNSNALDESKRQLLTTVAGLGTTRGAGANSLAELAVLVTGAARDGTISADTKSSDVADIWAAFLEANNRAKVDVDPSQAKDNSQTVQISKLRVFAKLGSLSPKAGALKFDPPKFMTFARETIAKSGQTKMPTYQALCLIARQQIAAFKKDEKCKGLTVTQIKALITPEEKGDDDRTMEQYELDELEAIHKRLVKLSNGTDERGPCDAKEISKAFETLNGRIIQLRTKLGVKAE